MSLAEVSAGAHGDAPALTCQRAGLTSLWNGCRGGDVSQVCGDSPGCGSLGNLICGPLWGERDGQEQLVLSQGLEIQANTWSRASLLAHRLEERRLLPSAPGLLSGSRSGHPFEGKFGAEGFAGGNSGGMLGTSCCSSPQEGLRVGNVVAAI